MVLWEMTLATAYFLGLRRTYRLALGIQRRLIGPNNPRIRQFLHRRTRSIFDVAVNVHRNIKHRDMEAGRNLGNWVLRWLDHMKPSAEMRSHPTSWCSDRIPKQIMSKKPHAKLVDGVSKGRLLFARWNARASSPIIAMMVKPMRPLAMSSHHRQFHDVASQKPFVSHGFGRCRAVFRNDIALWMQGR